MAFAFYQCKVTQTGPASDSQGLPNPAIYVKLSDLAHPPAFTDKWFYAADVAKTEILTVAINAITSRLTVEVYTEPPGPADAYKEVRRIYLTP